MMTSHSDRPSANELKDLLSEKDFATENAKEALTVSEPVTPTPLVLSLQQISVFDNNPRRVRNPAYDEIKASIREQRGLNNPFTVTRRPGATHYMVQSGGNTRLAILHELYQETGDETFNSVHCFYVPWQSEASVLCAHLIENELRGEITLIDKAYAIGTLKNQLEQGAESPLSRRELCKQIKALGYSVSRRHLIRLEYALELDQLIPNSLRNGLGANRIDLIKNTEQAYRHCCQDKTEQWDALFAHVLSSYDADWDFDAVRRDLDQQLAVILNTTPQRLRKEVDAVLFNQTAEEEHDTGDPQSARQLVTTDETCGQSDARQPNDAPETHRNQHPERRINKQPRQNASLDASRHTELSGETGLTRAVDLPALYDLTYRLARRIAQSIAMEHLVLPIDQGLGFIVEKPDAAFTALDTWGLWWLLIGLSEQSVSDERFYVWQHTALYQLYSGQDEETLQQWVGPAPSLPMYPHEVLNDPALIDDPVFTHIVQLMGACRSIRRHYSSTRLWPNGH